MAQKQISLHKHATNIMQQAITPVSGVKREAYFQKLDREGKPPSFNGLHDCMIN